MGSSNLPLILWYVFCALTGALVYRKKRWLGGLIGLAVAFILITFFAILMSP